MARSFRSASRINAGSKMASTVAHEIKSRVFHEESMKVSWEDWCRGTRLCKDRQSCATMSAISIGGEKWGRSNPRA